MSTVTKEQRERNRARRQRAVASRRRDYTPRVVKQHVGRKTHYFDAHGHALLGRTDECVRYVEHISYPPLPGERARMFRLINDEWTYMGTVATTCDHSTDEAPIEDK